MAITSGTPITLTAAQFFGGIVLLISGMGGVSWWASSAAMTGFEGHLSSMATAVQNLQGADKDSVIRLDSTAEKLNTQLANLSLQIVALNGKLDVTNNSLDFLNKRVDGIVPPKGR
jgi:hypothetical protein